MEYLPLKESPGSASNAPIVAEFLSTFARKSGPAGETDILAVELDEAIWATVAKGPDDLSPDSMKTEAKPEDMDIDEDDDLFCTTENPEPPSETTSRERRSAFLILRCLQGEGLL